MTYSASMFVLIFLTSVILGTTTDAADSNEAGTQHTTHSEGAQGTTAASVVNDEKQKKDGGNGNAKQDAPPGEIFWNVNKWNEDMLVPKIKIRLVKRSWRPFGHSIESEAVLDEYEGDVEKAQECFEKSSPYDYEEKSLEQSHELLVDGDDFKSNLPNIIIIHPLFTDANCRFVKNTITALAMRNLHLANNIFVVNMPELNYFMFATTVLFYMKKTSNFNTLAKALSTFFMKGMKQGVMTPEKIHLIGFGYSARLSGYIGSYIFQETNVKIASILALDPFGSPNNINGGPITKEDATVVHIYHTNAFPIGTMDRRGTADFTFNGGIVQPECKGNPSQWMCSHKKVAQRFWYVILYGGKQQFQARRCIMFIRYYIGGCNAEDVVSLTYPIVNNDVRGNFYLMTSEKPPYGLGQDGCTNPTDTIDRLRKDMKAMKDTNHAFKLDRELMEMMLV